MRWRNKMAETEVKDSRAEQAATLERIAQKLSEKYPGDWYERLWKGPHLFYSTAFYGLGVWGWTKTNSVAAGLMLPLAWYLSIVLMPRLILGRVAHAPRWAHPAAKLESEDVHAVNRVAAGLGNDFKAAVAPLLPVMTGDRFWTVLKQARVVCRRQRR